jgi:UDP-N-acetyl-2-amino-2-deoxyglucuronate dehydrogenase
MDGGALMNQSIHHIDALQWLMGEVDNVFAYTATLAHKMEAEDMGVAVLHFTSGALGSVEGSTITFPENLEGSVAVFGGRGSAKIGGTALNRKVLWKIEGQIEHERVADAGSSGSAICLWHQPQAVLADMLNAIREDYQPETNGTEARTSLALVLAIYESARSGVPVKPNRGAAAGR